MWILSIYANTCTIHLVKHRTPTQNPLDTRIGKQQQMFFSLSSEASEQEQLRFVQVPFKKRVRVIFTGIVPSVDSGEMLQHGDAASLSVAASLQ